MPLPQVHISPIQVLAGEVARICPDYVISITDPRGSDVDRIAAIMKRTGTSYTGLSFYDLDRIVGGFTAPSLPMVRDMCAALDRDMPEAPGRLLVHCHAGLSRSPAIAMIALAHFAQREAHLTDERGREIARAVFEAQPLAIPNKRIMSIAKSIFRGPGRAMAEEARALEAAASRSPAEPTNIW